MNFGHGSEMPRLRHSCGACCLLFALLGSTSSVFRRYVDDCVTLAELAVFYLLCWAVQHLCLGGMLMIASLLQSLLSFVCFSGQYIICV